MSMPAIAAFAAALQLSAAIAQPVSEPSPLSLAEAVLIAGQAEDPAIGSLRSRAGALERAGEAAMALPDPTLRVGLANLPLSNLDPNREAMTQMQVGVRQVIPSIASRHLQRERQRAQAQGVLALGGLEQRLITR